MHLVTVIFLGIAANLDNLCIGLSYGLAGRRIRLLHNFIISLISGIFTFVACEAARLISPEHVKYSVYAGAALLIGIGLYTIFAAVVKAPGGSEKEEAAGEVKRSGLGGVVLLGVLLAINNLAAAFAAGLAAVSPLALSVSMTVFSVVCVGAGNFAGKKVSRLFSGELVNVLSGVMLLAVGVWELLG